MEPQGGARDNTEINADVKLGIIFSYSYQPMLTSFEDSQIDAISKPGELNKY